MQNDILISLSSYLTFTIRSAIHFVWFSATFFWASQQNNNFHSIFGCERNNQLVQTFILLIRVERVICYNLENDHLFLFFLFFFWLAKFEFLLKNRWNYLKTIFYQSVDARCLSVHHGKVQWCWRANHFWSEVRRKSRTNPLCWVYLKLFLVCTEADFNLSKYENQIISI